MPGKGTPPTPSQPIPHTKTTVELISVEIGVNKQVKDDQTIWQFVLQDKHNDTTYVYAFGPEVKEYIIKGLTGGLLIPGANGG